MNTAPDPQQLAEDIRVAKKKMQQAFDEFHEHIEQIQKEKQELGQEIQHRLDKEKINQIEQFFKE